RLALVGVGKEDAQLLLIPEGAKNHFGNRFFLCLFNPLIGGFDDQKIFFRESSRCICYWTSGRHSGSESGGQLNDGLVLKIRRDYTKEKERRWRSSPY